MQILILEELILSCELSRDILEFELSIEHNPIKHSPYM
jgi:hypothetical protein